MKIYPLTIKLNKTNPGARHVTTAIVPIIIAALLITGCRSQLKTAPPDFSVISSPEVPVIEKSTPTPSPTEPSAEAAVPVATDSTLFEMVPAKVVVTVEPSTPTPEVEPSETPTEAVQEESATDTVTPENTEETPVPAKPAGPPDAPRKGGSWDMEDGFEVWINPFGDNCSGSKVAVGWKGFTSRGQYGSSCLYINEYGPNVYSGRSSQQVTFDFTDSHAGLYRIIDTRPGHTYQVTARLKHVHTLPPMQYHFGFDLTGGGNWEGETVTWAPWDEFREDDWITHEETFAATGEQTTIFIKGFHDTASQGGATYIDAIEIIDLG